MGVVYLAEDTQLGRDVALKFLPPHLSSDETTKKRFIQEAQAASSLHHRHICTIYEIGETDDEELFIAMALYEGETLKARMERDPLTVGEAALIAAQIADGLSKAHHKGIVHRDIKPSNIMLDEHGDAIILDFGLAKLSSAVELTATGKTLGTAAYMSPEQMRGDAVGPQTDVWSLGVLVYEMLAGARPFLGEYEQALAYSILNVEPSPLPPPPRVPEGLALVVSGCLEKDVADRFASAAEMREALLPFLPGSAQFTATSLSALERAASSLTRLKPLHRGVWIAAVVVLLAAVGIFAVTRTVDRAGEMQLMAVLPFTVIGDAVDGDTYAAGLAETLTSKLTRLELSKGSVAVIPASEILGPMTAAAAREQLGATMAVTGSLQFQDGRIRLTLNIIDTKSRRQVDSRLVDYDLTSRLALQDQALFLVAEMLRMELDPAAREAVTASSSSDRFANDFYIRGRGRLRAAQSLEDIDAAISLFELAVTQDSLFAVGIAGLGEAFWKKYQRTDDVQFADRAIAASERALRIDDAQLRVYVTLGTIYEGRGMHDDAIRALEQAANLDPSDPEIYLQRGTAWRRQNRYDLAESDYRRAIALEPGYWRGHAYLGSLFWRQSQYENARSAWQRGLEAAPGNADLLANVGAAYWALERPADAVEQFEKVLQSNPNHARAKSNLGTAYFYMERFEEAARLYEDRVSLTPRDRDATANLADTYYWIPGARDKSAPLYRRAIQLANEQLTIQPNDPGLQADLAYYYAALNRPDSAALFMNGALIRVSPDSSDVNQVYGIGETYDRMGERDLAIEWITAALKRDINPIRLRHNPFLEDLRKDPRMREYLDGE
jgi:serine/threonine-protein kinase